MRNVVLGAAGVAAALLGHMVLSRTMAEGTPTLHVFLLAVLFGALTKGEIFGAVMGTCCGLAADSLSIGVFGLSGFSMTVVGFVAGLAAKRVNVLPFVRNAAFLYLMTALDLVLWGLWARLTVGQPIGALKNLLLTRPLVTALVGAAAFAVFRWWRKRYGR
ncbi:MAG: rod shape-determining protein MreD [Candidatus Aminicenantes bacterium]|nr:rod shape-determining protein MreD [Candidatus Aminicenantes bacterium]